MSRHIQPMPPESDRILVIRSYGDQEPPRPEPASRSPSPDIPPNFVPEAPKDSSNFPACSNIINMIERISGGVRASEQIIVPAHIWDRNNTHWEHKMTQLRRKHRKELAEKETEIRIKYDQLYSEGRYREQLLAKEMKELEFAQGVTGGFVVFGKTWKEHKAAKKDMEEKHIKKIESIEKELTESLSTVEALRKALAEKQTAIEALEKAIGKRDDQAPAPVPQQSIQQMQIVQPNQLVQVRQPQQPQQFQQVQSQYYPQQQSTSTLGTTAQTPFQMAQAIFQQAVALPYAQQQQRQQQQQQQQQLQGTTNSMTLFNGGPPPITPQLTARSTPFYEPPFPNANVPPFGSTAHYDSGKTQGVDYQNTNLHGNGMISSINKQGSDKSSQLAPAPPVVTTTPGCNLPFGAPQTPQTDIEMVTNQPLVLNVTGLRSTHGLSGPFGTPNQALVSTRPTPGQIAENSVARLKATNEKGRPSEIAKKPKQAPSHSGSLALTLSRHQLPSKAGPQAPIIEKAGSQKRPHSAFSIDGHIRSQASGDKKQRDLPSIQQEDSSEDEDDGEPNAFPKKRRYQPTTPGPSKSSGKTPSGPFATGSSSMKKFTPKNALVGQRNADKDVQNTRVDKLRKGAQGVGTQDIERVPVRTGPPSSYERMKAASVLMQAAKSRNRAIFVTLKLGLGWTGPEYIISKVRGGQLESIKVVEEKRKVYITFISPDAAQIFHDFFNKEPDAFHADSRFKMDVQWSHPAILEIPNKLAEAIACGATRCLKVFQVSKDKRPEDIKMDLNPDEEPWNITDFLIVDDTSERKNKREASKTVTIDLSSIELATKVKEMVEGGLLPGYENCDVEYSDDPCAIKDGKPCSMDYYRSW